MRVLTRFIKPNPPIEKTTLDRVEFFQKITLPQDYKEFLLSYNGGKLYYNSFVRSLDDNDSQSNALDSFDEVDEDTQFLDGDEYDELRERAILPIGSTLVPGLVGLCLKEKGYGSIYIMDWDFGLTLQAPSFTKFLEQIEFNEPTENWQNEDPAFA